MISIFIVRVLWSRLTAECSRVLFPRLQEGDAIERHFSVSNERLGMARERDLVFLGWITSDNPPTPRFWSVERPDIYSVICI